MTTGTAVLCSTTELCALLLYPFLFSFRICPTSFFSKKTPPVGLEPTTLRLKAARSTDWARKALTYPFFFSFSPFFLSVFSQKGLRRESNPGHPHPKRVFYHLTTKPFYSFFFLPILYPITKIFIGLWRESNPRHLHPKQVFYHLTTKPLFFFIYYTYIYILFLYTDYFFFFNIYKHI